MTLEQALRHKKRAINTLANRKVQRKTEGNSEWYIMYDLQGYRVGFADNLYAIEVACDNGVVDHSNRWE